MAAALLAVAILPWALGGGGNVWVSLTGLVLGVSILVRSSRAATASSRRACGSRTPSQPRLMR